MGRKNAASVAKSKEKRMQRKEEQNRISQAMATVADANRLEDPMAPFPVFKTFKKNGIDAELFVRKFLDLDNTIKQWAFNLTKRNMEQKYQQCSWGWSDQKKWEEMSEDSAWYLVAKSRNNELLGFSHFRFDLDNGIEVLYCYELHLEPSVQRRGLGKFMMQILELIGFTNNMRKVILTVLKHNQYSKFFKTINYELDETSPVDDGEETYPYEILCKVNKRLPMPTMVKTPKAVSASHTHCCSGHGHHH